MKYNKYGTTELLDEKWGSLEGLNEEIKKRENKLWPDGNKKRHLHYTEQYDKDGLDLLYEIRSRWKKILKEDSRLVEEE